MRKEMDEERFSQATFDPPSLDRIDIPSVAQAAAQAIREAIITRKLKPGQRLVERTLASSLGIGQPTLREALKELEYQGVVNKVPQRGTHIANLSDGDVRKVLEIRTVLEALAIERATHNLTPEFSEELTLLLRRMRLAAERVDCLEFHETQSDFHRRVWALADNSILSAALEAVAFRLFVFGFMDYVDSLSADLKDTARMYGKILTGLRSGDPINARTSYVNEILHHWKQYHRVSFEDGEISWLAFPQPSAEPPPSSEEFSSPSK